MGKQERRFKMLDLLFRAGEFNSIDQYTQACLDNGICSIDIAKHDISLLKKLAIIQTVKNGKPTKIRSLLSVQMAPDDYFDLMESYGIVLSQIKKDAREIEKIATYHKKVNDSKFLELMNKGRDILSQLQFNVDILELMRVDYRFYKSPSKRDEIDDMIDSYQKAKKNIQRDLNKAHNDLSYQITFRRIADNL